MSTSGLDVWKRSEKQKKHAVSYIMITICDLESFEVNCFHRPVIEVSKHSTVATVPKKVRRVFPLVMRECILVKLCKQVLIG